MSTTITEHPNAELIRRGYEAFNTADMQTLTELFDEGASWHTPGRSPIAATTAAATRSSVFELADGRIVDGREYVFDLYAWDEFWS